MPVLQLRMSEDSKRAVGTQRLHDFRKGHTISQRLLQLNNWWNRFLDDILDPLLRLSNMAKVFIGLKEFSLLIHPISRSPRRGIFPSGGFTTSIGTLKASSSLESDNGGRRAVDREFFALSRFRNFREGAKMACGGLLKRLQLGSRHGPGNNWCIGGRQAV